MSWIMNNKEWLFSGIGATIIGGIGTFWGIWTKRGKHTPLDNKNVLNSQQTVNIYNGVETPIFTKEPSKEEETKSNTDKKLTTHILFIDDEKFDNVDILKQAGWIYTKRIKDIKRIDCDEVKTANIVFVDINGVGATLFPKEQGLGVAAKIKEMYPQKYVVVYSAQPQQLHQFLNRVDAILPKDADPYQYISVLENL